MADRTLSLCCLCLLQLFSSWMLPVAGSGNVRKLINEPLVIKHIDQSCDAQNLTGFYSAVRNAHQAERMFPSWNDPGGPGDNHQPGLEHYWPDQPYQEFLSTNGLLPEIFIYGFPSTYKWCIYLYSKNADVYGCARDNITWGSPAFERLGILDKFHALNVQDEFGLPQPLMALNITTLHLQTYTYGNDLWHNSMIVFTGDWNRTDVSSISNFFIVNTARGRIQYIRDFPSQENAFLVVGEEKHFLCIAYGGFRTLASGWLYGKNNISAAIPYDQVECLTSNRSGNNNCGDVSVREEFHGIESCVQYNSFVYKFGTTTHNLIFWNATAEDTGQYTCYTKFRNEQDRRGHNETLYIYVAFVEVPQRVATLMSNDSGHLKFVVKAPKNSNLTLLQSGKKLEDFGDNKSSCDDTALVSQTSSSLDNFYSLYTAEINICNVSKESSGRYECQVHYFVEGKDYLVKYEQVVTVMQDDKVDSTSASHKKQMLSISLGVVGGIIAVVAVGLVVFIFILTRMKMRHKTAHLKAPLPLMMLAGDRDMNKSFVSTGSEPNSNPKEFLRENIEFHEQIGKIMNIVALFCKEITDTFVLETEL